jgi:hypothetical protein
LTSLILIFPATVLAVAGYLAFYAALRSSGTMQAFGRVLATWTLLLSGFLGLLAVVAPFFGIPLFEFGESPDDRRLRHEIRMRDPRGGGFPPPMQPNAPRPPAN